MANITGQADKGMLEANELAVGDGGAAIAQYTAFSSGFKDKSKPGMDHLNKIYQEQQATFKQLMENKPNLDTVPFLTDTQINGNENVPGMEGLMKEVSGMYQENASILSRNKNDMKAQKDITTAAGYIQNIDKGNQQLVDIRYGNYELNGNYNGSLNPRQQNHLALIHTTLEGEDTGVKIEYPKEDDYKMKVTMPDGTIYGTNANNPLPLPQGDYNNGGTAANDYFTEKEQKGISATSPLTAETAAKELLSKIKDGKSDKDSESPATSGEKMSMMFMDILPDDEDLTYANAFASGKLPKEFYQDENGEIMNFDKREYTPGVEVGGSPALDKDGNFLWTKEEAEDFLRQKTGLDHNLKNMAKWYGQGVADVHNEQYNIKENIKGRYLRGAQGEAIYGTKKEIDTQKRELYVDMLVAKSVGGIDNTRNLLKTNPKQAMKNLQTAFRGTGINLGPLKDKKKPNHVGIIIGKEKRAFDLSTEQGFNLFTSYLSTQKIFKQMPLDGNPQGWETFNGESMKAFDTRASF